MRETQIENAVSNLDFVFEDFKRICEYYLKKDTLEGETKSGYRDLLVKVIKPSHVDLIHAIIEEIHILAGPE